MEQENLLPFLADVIIKVKKQQELTADEELLYLIHIENIPEAEAQLLIKQWFDEAGFNYQA